MQKYHSEAVLSGHASWCAPISDHEFEFIRRLAHEHAGLSIAEYKRNMVYRRVTKRLRALQIETLREYISLLNSNAGSDEIGLLINALTTNTTSFFREPHHFTHLAQEFLPELASIATAGSNCRLRVWSAGCSSGEEAYSIAITLRDAGCLTGWDKRILATDIDTGTLSTARIGAYDRGAIGGLPQDMVKRHFDPVGGAEAVRVKPALRELVTFKSLNLMERWPVNGPFDAIFCRNVVIYFDKATQRALFDRFADLLSPNGRLFIGHSETLYRVSERFVSIGRGIYRPVAAGHFDGVSA